jgi:hypothetical protein
MEKRRQQDRRGTCAVPRAGSAADVAKAGSAEACLAALDNPCAGIGPSAIARIAGRFGHLGAVREALLARSDLPLVVRLHLVVQSSGALAGVVAGRGWLTRDRAEHAGREACDKAVITIAALHPDHDIHPLIRHLQTSGQLTVELMLRALLSGHVEMFECALSERAGLPVRRVQAIVRDGGGLRTVFDKAGLPPSAGVVLRGMLTAAAKMRRNGKRNGKYAGGGLERSLVERAIRNCAFSDIGDCDPLMVLLHRFAAEAAGEDPIENGERLPADGFQTASPARRNQTGGTRPVGPRRKTPPQGAASVTDLSNRP